MISEKYLAGFLDSDGSICISSFDNRLRLKLVFSQKESKDRVLYLIRSEYGGTIHTQTINGKNYTTLSIPHNLAVQILNRIGKHCVIKKDYVKYCLDASSENYASKEETFKAREQLKTLRKHKTAYIRNYPSRKWLAGYFDGDGCISHGAILKPSGACYPVAVIGCANFDKEGIELIQKIFGGNIFDYKRTCKQWRLALDPAKAVQFLEYFSDYLIVKQDEAKLILKCAREHKHFRDGENIKLALQALKAHPHRLNEKALSLSDLFDTIRDLPKYARKDYKDFKRDINGRIIGK